MKRTGFLLLFLLSLQTVQAQKYIAVTVDDLPFVGADGDIKKVKEATGSMLKTLKKHKVKAVGFVNEAYILDRNRIKGNDEVLVNWLIKGHELGNHTFSHMSLTKNTLEAYQEDVLSGMRHSNTLNIGYRHQPIRYFRHPYLQTGNDSLKKYGLEAFLKAYDLIPVPVTLEADDWYFNQGYRKLLEDGKTSGAEEIGRLYVAHTLTAVKYYEALAQEVAGRPIKHIFLIHANALNARYLEEILNELEKQGYTFITVEEAMKDEVYQLPDRVLSEGGFSWLHRWRITAGKKTALREPQIPQMVVDAYEK